MITIGSCLLPMLVLILVPCAVLCCAVPWPPCVPAVLSPSGRVCFLPPGCVVYQV